MFIRKIIFLFTAASVLLCTGCGSAGAPDLFPIGSGGAFSAVCKVEYTDGAYTASVVCDGGGVLTLTLTAPPERRAVIYRLGTDGVLTICDGDRIFKPEAVAGADGAIAGLLEFFSLDESDFVSARLCEITGVRLNRMLFRDGEGEIAVYVSSSTGVPVRFERLGEDGGTVLSADISEYESE